MLLKSNGTTFHCSIDGEIGAPWLMLSHGLATDMSLWDDIIPVLRQHFRILRYDARGHGGSMSTAGDYSMDMLCRDAVGLLDALNIDRAHFLGLSMGGMVCAGMALDYPKRIAGAIVCDARATSDEPYRKAWAARIDKLDAEGIEGIVDSSVSRWLTDQTLRTAPQLVERTRAMIRRTSPAGYRGCAAALMQLNYGERLGEIRLPVLYLVGQEDQGAPPATMLDMHRATPGSRFVGIPHAGHLSVLERPEVFATSVVGFLSELAEAHAPPPQTTALNQ